MEANELKALISETFPEIDMTTFALMAKGKAGVLCLVNDEIVFKIPLKNNDEIIRWQKNEPEVLKFLENKQDRLLVEIPKILYTGISECGVFIFGETLLSGTTLTYDMYDTFDEHTRNDILQQLGRIVRQLHDAGGNDPSWQSDRHEDSLKDRLIEFDQRFSFEVQSVFTEMEIKKIKDIAKHYETITMAHPVNPVLCHYDLHFGNLMFDMEAKKITGLLDFGCAGYSEPAADWHYYLEPEYILKGYGETSDIYFLDRQKFHALSWSLNILGDEISNDNKSYKYLDYIRKYFLN